ncbi:MAG TPA: S53 family peptidase [Opitutaceae bacterium]|jgi:kumamolisin
MGSRILAVATALMSLGSPANAATDGHVVARSVRTPDSGGQTIGRARIVRALTAGELAAPMTFSVTLRMRDFAGLEARLASGEQISAAEMEARYLPLRTDYSRVSNWLTGQGFRPTLRDRLHMTVFVKGAVSGVARTLGVQFARVAVSDGEYSSAISEPSVPGDLAGVVLSVNGLQPEFRLRHVTANLRQAPDDLLGDQVFVTPGDVIASYNFPPNATGAGQVIAIAGQAAAPDTDFSAFWSEIGSYQSAKNVVTIDVDGGPGPDSDAALETDLDVEWAGAIAPGASIRLYLAQDAFDSLTQISNDIPAYPTMSVISFSFGGTESIEGTASMQALSQVTAAFAAAGVSFLASSGDAGSNPGGDTGDYSSTAPLAVSYPASDPDVTGVGGTTVTYTGYWVYAGETVWNQVSDPTHPSPNASGGGVSSYFAQPSWQTGGPVLGGQAMRCVPDVAAVADADYSLVNVGMQYQPVNGTNYGVLVYDGSGNPAGNDAVGGTSVACPIWAGITAIVNQARLSNGKGPIGLLNPHLYPLVGTNVFNDITSGNNEAYSAGPGYDLCTGLGTPNVANLVAALAGNPSQRLANISTRALVGTGGNILIPGLYISGTGIEALLIRADGPALTQFGVSGVLTKPTLSVYDSSGKLVTSNTGWMTDPNYLFLAMEAAKVGAFQLGNSSADCEIVTGLAPGAYTVQVSGVADTSGVALAEVYEVASYGTARLANMSTRAMVGTGGNIIIPGIYISGAGVEELLVRADGPALAQFGVSGVLARPTLSVFNSVGTMVASNTGWGTGADAAQIPAISASVGAFPLAANSADCALIVKLEAGSYTIQVSGVGNSTGIALAEVYEITSP